MANILIADDDTDSRELLKFTLTSMGHEVTSAHNGAEALASARRQLPDVIISDILMPEMDGFELCREVKHDERLKVIPFIFYTATYVSAEDEKLARDLGGSGFIRKADDVAEFVTLLENLIRQTSSNAMHAPLKPRESLSELEAQHEKVVTKKLAKKLIELQAERAAHQESAERLRLALEAAHMGTFDWDIPNNKITWSRWHEELWGFKPGEFGGTYEAFAQRVHTDDMPRIDSEVARCIASREPFLQEFRVVRPTGGTIWISGRGEFTFGDDGQPLRMRGAVMDINAQKQAEAEVLKLSLAVEQSPNSIVITDLNANIEYVNNTFVELTGYTRQELIGKNPRILKSGKTPESTYKDMWAHLARGELWRGELTNKRKSGSEYIESVQISPVRQPDGKISHYLAIKENITEAKEAASRIEMLAHFDQLTGLPNRFTLSERFNYALNLAQRSGDPLTVMFLDLDHFKNINDTLGHSIGDQLLMEVSRRIKATLREEDTVSRLGGDEFILLLHDTDSGGAAHVATKLIEAIPQPYMIEHHELITTVSIGIAIYPHDGKDLESLSKNADAAMYRVKQSGRNDFRFYTPELQVNSARELQLANALRHALARNEFTLNYQPQISLQDGSVVGAEALLRWQHPELGMVSPGEFIPIAEDTGQIIAIGEWVLRTAAKQLKRWLDAGLPTMVMAVNLSSVQFHQINITGLVTQILDELALPHACLELELTEAVAMNDPLAAIAVMDELHEQGIRMSIDDFGTGYSSLSYLKKFKVYKLKIDQSFVRDITDDPDDKAIVSAIINMASSLGIHTIAEGVETAGQLAFLRLQGCDEVQGYYFSKPITAELFEAFVRNKSQ